MIQPLSDRFGRALPLNLGRAEQRRASRPSSPGSGSADHRASGRPIRRPETPWRSPAPGGSNRAGAPPPTGASAVLRRRSAARCGRTRPDRIGVPQAGGAEGQACDQRLILVASFRRRCLAARQRGASGLEAFQCGIERRDGGSRSLPRQRRGHVSAAAISAWRAGRWPPCRCVVRCKSVAPAPWPGSHRAGPDANGPASLRIAVRRAISALAWRVSRWPATVPSSRPGGGSAHRTGDTRRPSRANPDRADQRRVALSEPAGRLRD